MTHEYTLLVGGTVIPGGDAPDVTAIAWAGDTILALGTDEEVLAISRGDSHLLDLQGAWVVALAPDEDDDPGLIVLEVGGRADLAVLRRDPGLGPIGEPKARQADALAIIRSGRIVAGVLPGLHRLDHDEDPGRDHRS